MIGPQREGQWATGVFTYKHAARSQRGESRPDSKPRLSAGLGAKARVAAGGVLDSGPDLAPPDGATGEGGLHVTAGGE